MTGWRLGWLAAAAPVIAEIAKSSAITWYRAPFSFEMDAAARAPHRRPNPHARSLPSPPQTVLTALNNIGLDVVEAAGAFYTFPSIKSSA